MKWKKVYLDIEATYTGPIDPEQNRDGFFKDFQNWKFYAEKEHNGKKVEYKGIIGILVVNFDIDENTNVYKVESKKSVQLTGKGCTKENLMKYVDGANEIIGYHCRSKPNRKGYIGYDFPVIYAQLGIMLDDLPGVKCIDLELLAHNANMYGGLKEVEKKVPGIPPRTSGVANGLEEEKLLLECAACEDEEKRKEMWKKAKRYNMEDVYNLVFIEHYLRDDFMVKE